MITVFDFGLDLWIELIVLNDLSNQDILNLSLTCKFFSQLLKKEKIIHFVEDRQIHFGIYQDQDESGMKALTWSHDNRVLASISFAGKIFIWNVKTGTLNKKFEIKHGSFFHCLRFHPRNTNLLAVGDDDGITYLWNIEKSEIEKNYKDHHSSIFCIAFDPQGRFLASGNAASIVQVWNVENGKCEKKMDNLMNSVDSVEFTNDGQYLGASICHSILLIWNVDTFQLVQKVVPKTVSHDNCFFKFFTDNKTLILINCIQEKALIYDFLSGSEKSEMSFQTQMTHHLCISIHPNQKIVCFGGIKGFEMWNIQSKKLLLNGEAVHDLSFSPNGKALALQFRDHAQVVDMKEYL